MYLVGNEMGKLRRDVSLVFLLALTLLPVATGAVGAAVGDKGSASELIFFINNQFAMFFPMVVVMLSGSVLCREWRDGTYLVWVSYGLPKGRLLAAKAITCALVSLSLSLVALFAISLACLILSADDAAVTLSILFDFVPGFAVESFSIVCLGTVAGLLIGSAFRSSLAVNAFAVAYGFVSCLFIGAEWSFVVPGSFAYRVATACLDPLTYYGSPLLATAGGLISMLAFLSTLTMTLCFTFCRGRKIEA